MTGFYHLPANCQVPELDAKWEAIFGRRNVGFFVEVGAYDGENFSNTSCLADAGWGGLYIEPVREFADLCRARHAGNPDVKTIESAVSATSGEVEIHIGDTLTTIVGEQVADYETIDWAKGLHRGETRRVPTERLDAILEREHVKPGFDLVVVDVEGAEDQVFAGFDLVRWNPKAVLVELEDEHPDFHDNPRVVAVAGEVRARCDAAGYRLYFKDHINSLYLRGDIYECAQRCAFEPAGTESVSVSSVEEAGTRARPSLNPKMPRVTIGIPVFNGAATLQLALDSISRQTYREFVVIVADNGSTDETPRLLDRFAEQPPNVNVIHRATGIPAWENFTDLARRAGTDYFVWLADDDWWEPDFLKECIAALDRNQYAVTAFTHSRVYYHYLDRFSGIVGQAPSLSHDASLNFIIRASEMAPAAVYGVHRRAALLAAIDASVLPFDFSDVFITLALALHGMMEVVPRDLFRAGVRTEAKVRRDSLDGGRIRYLPFIKAANRLIFRRFSRFRALLVALNFNWRNFVNYRHLKRHNLTGAELDVSQLMTADQVAAGDTLPTSVRAATPSAPPPTGYAAIATFAATVPEHPPLAEVHNFNALTRNAWVAAKAATIPGGSRVLDVGAGTGPYRTLLAHCRYETQDFSQYEGYRGAEGTYTPIDYVSDIVSIPVPDASFDVVLCTEVLEHVPRPIDALAEMVRIVRPGGQLILTAPLGSGLHQEPYHFYGGFSNHWYRKFLDELGCDIEEITPNHGWFANLAQECARFSWTFGRHAELHGSFGPMLSDLIGNTLARYFYSLDDKAFMREFTVGFHVSARKRLA